MTTTAIDTLRYARRLKNAGVPADQAEAMADAIGAELVDQLATKADLKATRTDVSAAVAATRADLKATRTDLSAAVAATRTDLNAAVAATRADLNAAVLRLEGSIRLLQWMLGFTLAFVVAIAWRVFG